MLGSESSEALFERARELHRNQQWIEAAQCYEAILASEPENHKVLHLLGLLSHQAGDAELALDLLHKAIQLEPNESAYYVNFGSALQALNHFDVAIDAYDVALSLDPTLFEALNNRAHIRMQQGDKAQAIADLQALIRIRPADHEISFKLAACLEDLGRDSEAADVYQRLIQRALSPDFERDQKASQGILLAARINLALCLLRLDQAEDALEAIGAALVMDSRHGLAHTTLGHVLRELERYDEALCAYQVACELHEQSAESLVHLGMAHRECLDLERAIHYYDQALSKRFAWKDAMWNKSIALLLKGSYREGFKLYESRWHRSDFQAQQHAMRHLPSKALIQVMQNEDIQANHIGALINSKRVLVLAEQGFGDSLQFARFMRLIEAHGAKLYFHAPLPLQRLMQQFAKDIVVSATSDSLSALQHEVDFHIPLLSIPYLFGLELKDIEQGPHCYLKASQTSKEKWASLLAKVSAPLDKSVKPLLGIMWRGANTNPRNFRRRSVPLESFIKTLGDLPYQLVSLQIDPTEAELELMLKAKIVSLHEDVTDFDDTAAIIEQLHCVVTVDTSVGHLCGGLGAPTVAIIPYQADWRWMLEREDSPWYPSLKLLRRSLDDADGAEVLRRARQSLLMTQA